MTDAVEWAHARFTPYEVLGVPVDAPIADIRRSFKQMALATHPDKLPGTDASAHSFLDVKAAAEVLLDPARRARYDQLRCQSMIRGCGACSDTYDLLEDFELVEEEAVDGAATMQVYQRECRCGGLYEVIRISAAREAGAAAGGRAGEAPVMCECDSCSLIVEVVL